MADSEIILTNAQITVDDEQVTVMANTIVIIEGQGETTVVSALRGGNPVIIPSTDESTRIGQIQFEMPSSVKSFNLSRDFKALGLGRVVTVSGTDPAGNSLARTMTQGIMTNEPPKNVQNEGTIPIEFMGGPLSVA